MRLLRFLRPSGSADMPSPEVCTLPRGFSGPLEQGFLVHSHMAIHSIEDGGNTISFVFRPNASCLAADGRHVLPGVLEVLNDTATTETIYAQTVNGTSAASVDLSTTFAAPVRADRLLEIVGVCDKHGRRLAPPQPARGAEAPSLAKVRPRRDRPAGGVVPRSRGVVEA